MQHRCGEPAKLGAEIGLACGKAAYCRRVQRQELCRYARAVGKPLPNHLYGHHLHRLIRSGVAGFLNRVRPAIPTDDETSLLVAISEIAPGYYARTVTWLYRQHDQQTSRRPEWRAIPVVVVTAKDLTADEQARLSGRVAEVLTAPRRSIVTA